MKDTLSAEHGTDDKLERKEEELEEKILEDKVPEEVKKVVPKRVDKDVSGLIGWEPKTLLGAEVKDGKVKNIDEILDKDRKILEEQVVDSLMDVKHDLISIGQAKGKFGGGKRRAWRQTNRITKEGRITTFSTMAVIGDGDGHVGIGSGRSKETLPARDKAIRKAKLNVIKINRACSSFDCDCSELHTVPFNVEGKSGSVRVVLMPAPQGTGLVVGGELKKILMLAGIKDVYSKTFGRKRTTFNLAKACFDALRKTNPKEVRR